MSTLLTSIGGRFSGEDNPIWGLEDSNVEIADDSRGWRGLSSLVCVHTDRQGDDIPRKF